MRKSIIIGFVIAITPLLIFAQGGGGKMRGVVIDEETGEALPGANITLEGTTLGASTNLKGEYIVLAVSPGLYTVRASYIGYRTIVISHVRVNANITTTQDFQLVTTAIVGEEIEVIAQRPLIQRNTTNTIRITTQEDIQNMPIRGLDNILALEAGTVLQDGILHVRGGREREIAYCSDNATATIPKVSLGTGGGGWSRKTLEYGENRKLL